mgnify:CR=1 FL=1
MCCMCALINNHSVDVYYEETVECLWMGAKGFYLHLYSIALKTFLHSLPDIIAAGTKILAHWHAADER